MTLADILLLLVLAPLALLAGVCLALGVFRLVELVVIGVFVIFREIVQDFWREWRESRRS